MATFGDWKRVVIWLPAALGFGSSLWLVFGPTISESGSYDSGSQVITWTRKISIFQDHFRHVGTLPAFMLLYLVALLLMGKQAQRGRLSTVLIASLGLAAVASMPSLLLYVPSLLLAALISLGLAKGWRYALGALVALVALGGGAVLYGRQQSAYERESPVRLGLHDSVSGRVYPVPMFPRYYHPDPSYYVVQLDYDQAVNWYAQAFSAYGYRAIWVSRDGGHLAAEYGLVGGGTPVLLLVQPWPVDDESRVTVRVGSMASP